MKKYCIDCGVLVEPRSTRCRPCHFSRLQGSNHPNWKGKPRSHPLYQTFHSMKTRCYNQNRADYKYYGGRGITIFGDWKDDFWAFASWVEKNLGSRPEHHTLDRIEVNGNYEPGNLRWADSTTQRLNTRPRGKAA